MNRSSVALLAAFVSLAAQTPNSSRNLPGMEFVRIEPGEFTMGCPDGDNACDADEPLTLVGRVTKVLTDNPRGWIISMPGTRRVR